MQPDTEEKSPRLEHVLDKAFSRTGDGHVSRAGDPRALLSLFAERTPNALHHAISDYLI